MQHLTILTGASRGMGLAMARQLCSADALLLCISRKESPALQQLALERGATLLQWPADLADPAPVAARVQAWLSAQGSGALASATLINNAGLVGRLGPLDPLNAPDIATTLRVDLEAPMLLTAAFLTATRGWSRAFVRRRTPFSPERCANAIARPTGWVGWRIMCISPCGFPAPCQSRTW